MKNLKQATLGSVAAAMMLASTAGAATDFKIGGLLDVVASERGAAFDFNLLTRGDSSFDPFSLRVFGEARVNDRLQILSQVVLRDASGLYIDGAYLVYTPNMNYDFNFTAGKIPWPIGTWAPRTYSDRNPLVGTPLMYQYHTTVLWWEIPPSADALLATAGSGQTNVDYYGYPMGRGAAIVDDSYWDVGATITGSRRPLEYSIGVVAGTPGWGSTSQDENSGKSWLGRIGLAPHPSLRFGVSGSTGPYLIQSLNPNLPAGKHVNDYHQELMMADFELQTGHVELRAEGARNIWESPTVGDLEATSGYAELKVSHASGVFAAGRADMIQFGDIQDSGGVNRSWDSDVERFEVGAGYRFDRSVIGKIVYQYTRVAAGGPRPDDLRLSLVAAQLSVRF